MICTKCNADKEPEKFSWRNKKTGIRQRKCKDCHKEYRDAHYRRNRTKRIAQARARDNRVKAETRTKICEYLSNHPCVDCGETDIVVLQFDHRRDKEKSMYTLVNNGAVWSTIWKEIQKCEVRCANCHIKRHAKEREYFTYTYQQLLQRYDGGVLCHQTLSSKSY